jgi:hypothetical protein
MNSPAELLNFVTTTLQLWPHTRHVHILTTAQFSSTQYAIKVRADLTNDDILQVRIYYNEGHIDYAYQVIRAGAPLIRWDNKEHFALLATYPHHFHSLSGQVLESLLTGLSNDDLPLVLHEIEKLLF